MNTPSETAFTNTVTHSATETGLTPWNSKNTFGTNGIWKQQYQYQDKMVYCRQRSEKCHIIFQKYDLPNKRNELLSSFRHTNKHLFCNFKNQKSKQDN